MKTTKKDLMAWFEGYPPETEIHVTDERGTEVPIQSLAHNPMSLRIVVDGTVATDVEMEWLLNRTAGE